MSPGARSVRPADRFSVNPIREVIHTTPESRSFTKIGDYQFRFRSDPFFPGYFYINLVSAEPVERSLVGVIFNNGRAILGLGSSSDEFNDRFRWKIEPHENGVSFKSKAEPYMLSRATDSVGRNFIWLNVSSSSDAPQNLWRLENANYPVDFKVKYPEGRSISSRNGLCPTIHSSGDREFLGNGPRVEVKAGLASGPYYRNSGESSNAMYLLVDFFARETKLDTSTVTGNFILPILYYSAQWDLKLDFPAERKVEFNYIFRREGPISFSDEDDLGHGLERDGLIHAMTIVGDTGGDDISDDSRCDDDTHIVEIQMNALDITATYLPNNQ